MKMLTSAIRIRFIGSAGMLIFGDTPYRGVKIRAPPKFFLSKFCARCVLNRYILKVKHISEVENNHFWNNILVMDAI